MAAVRRSPGIKKIEAMKAAPGRPAVNTRKFMVKPVAGERTGFEVLNDAPSVLDQAREKMATYDLPPALQPKYLRRPEVMDKQRGLNISRGWRKPRSQQG